MAGDVRNRRFVAVLGIVIVLASMSIGSALEAQETEPRAEPTIRPGKVSALGAPDDFGRLELEGNEVVLTNVSERPFVAWTIKYVVRSSQGVEAYSMIQEDYFRSPVFPGGEENFIAPGESVRVEKMGEPWVRDDHRGPGFGLFYEIGALVFAGGEAVGDPEIVERIFERRRDLTQNAMATMALLERGREVDESVLDDLPDIYRNRLNNYSDPAAATRALRERATRDFRNALTHLRPDDLRRLGIDEEVKP